MISNILYFLFKINISAVVWVAPSLSACFCNWASKGTADCTLPLSSRVESWEQISFPFGSLCATGAWWRLRLPCILSGFIWDFFPAWNVSMLRKSGLGLVCSWSTRLSSFSKVTKKKQLFISFLLTDISWILSILCFEQN